MDSVEWIAALEQPGGLKIRYRESTMGIYKPFNVRWIEPDGLLCMETLDEAPCWH